MSEEVKARARQVKFNVDDAFWELGDACPVQTPLVQDAVKNGLVFKVRNWVGQQPGAMQWIVIASAKALQDVDDKEAFVGQAVDACDQKAPDADWFASKHVALMPINVKNKRSDCLVAHLFTPGELAKENLKHLLEDIQWLMAKVVLPAAA